MNIEVKTSNRPIPYKTAINTLEKRVIDVRNGVKNELIWILEHPTTYTGGIRYKEEEILDKLKNENLTQEDLKDLYEKIQNNKKDKDE